MDARKTRALLRGLSAVSVEEAGSLPHKFIRQSKGGHMFRIALLASAAFAFAGQTANAAPAYTFSPDGRSIVATPADTPIVPGGLPKHKGAIVNEYASKYPNGLYWCCLGQPVAGPSSHLGSFLTAVAFTPTATKQATKITVGVGYISGTNSITVSLYSDSGDAPGTELASGTANNLAKNGACCSTATVTIPATTVTASTRYWVVLSAGANTFESWNDADADQVTQHEVSTNQTNGGWHTYSSIQYPSLEVQ
jgi:hypothetical protein